MLQDKYYEIPPSQRPDYTKYVYPRVKEALAAYATTWRKNLRGASGFSFTIEGSRKLAVTDCRQPRRLLLAAPEYNMPAVLCGSSLSMGAVSQQAFFSATCSTLTSNACQCHWLHLRITTSACAMQVLSHKQIQQLMQLRWLPTW